MKQDEQLIAELEEATRGLLFMSESDYPFQTFLWKNERELTPQYLREQAEKSLDAPVKVLSVEEFFRAAVSEPEWKRDEALALARRYQSLVRWLKENLDDLKVYRVGEIDIKVFVVGRNRETGSLLGISTQVIET